MSCSNTYFTNLQTNNRIQEPDELITDIFALNIYGPFKQLRWERVLKNTLHAQMNCKYISDTGQIPRF
jgi:hypothetical protein